MGPLTTPLSRRLLLRSVGSALALPLLDAMLPRQAAAQAAMSPKRLGVFCFPFGVHQQAWAPTSFGTGYTLPSNLSALAPHKDRVVVTKGLGAHGLPWGSHTVSVPYFTTEPIPGTSATQCAFQVRTKSADMIISDFIRQSAPQVQPLITRPADAYGFSGCYTHRGNSFEASLGSYLSWTGTTTAATQVQTPQAVFDRLFTGPAASPTPDPMVQWRRARGLSVLDSTLSQARSLDGKVGRDDRRKLDEYYASIREVERTLQAQTVPTVAPACSAPARPNGSLPFDQTTKAFLDLTVLAFVCDRARVATHVLDTEAEIHRVFPWLGITDTGAGHHLLSHTTSSEGGVAPADKPGQYLRITAWYAAQLAYLLERMKGINEGGHDLLYHSAIVFGSGMGPQGDSHDQYDLPVVLAGELQGQIRTGQALNAAGTRMANLWLALMQKFGINATSYASSTGALTL